METLRIVMCDSNIKELDEYVKICRGICEANGEEAEFRLYSDAGELLFDVEDSIFLALTNIFIVDPAGAFAAVPAAVRKRGYDGLILYYSHSTSIEHYHQAFDARANNFIQKGSDNTTLLRFRSVFAKSLEDAKRLNRQHIVVSCAGEYKQIEVKEIKYFEASDNMVEVNFNGGSFKFVSTMQSLEERLRGRGFIRIHRSYIVALDSIYYLGYEFVTLKNGQKIPVGRSYYPTLKSARDRWQA